MKSFQGPHLGQVRLVRRPALRGSPLELSDATFSQALAAPRAIVDFWSPECPYCVQFKPIFEAAATASNSDITFVEAEVDGAMKSAGSFNISGLPGIIFLKDGKEVGRTEGFMSQNDFLLKISQVFGSGVGGPGLAPGSSGSMSTGSKIWGGVAAAGVLAGSIWALTKVVKF